MYQYLQYLNYRQTLYRLVISNTYHCLALLCMMMVFSFLLRLMLMVIPGRFLCKNKKVDIF